MRLDSSSMCKCRLARRRGKRDRSGSLDLLARTIALASATASYTDRTCICSPRRELPWRTRVGRRAQDRAQQAVFELEGRSHRRSMCRLRCTGFSLRSSMFVPDDAAGTIEAGARLQGSMASPTAKPRSTRRALHWRTMRPRSAAVATCHRTIGGEYCDIDAGLVPSGVSLSVSAERPAADGHSI